MKRNRLFFRNGIKHINTGTRVLKACVLALVSPVSKDEDKKRQELILNIILLASILFLGFLDITVIVNTIRFSPHYHGINWIVFTSVVASCILMLVASKRGYAPIVSYGIIALYTTGSLYGGWHWGISLPATLLSFALISVASSVLIGSSFGFLMSGFLIVSLSILSVHEIYSIGILPWKYETITATDVVTYSSILIFIATLSWLSNREIYKSLDRARKSERALAAERDLLEIKVGERTAELRKAQAERMAEISRTAEFGRLSQGLFHDLMAPLSSVSLHMEKIRNLESPEIHEARAYLIKAINASHKMGNFMNLIRSQIKQSAKEKSDELHEQKRFSIDDELRNSIELLEYKARQAGVNIRTETDKTIEYFGDTVHFRRIFLNLISNAIEAHEDETGLQNGDCVEKKIEITVGKKANNIIIVVSDNGPGIPEKDTGSVFQAFFSTKSPDKGTGVGLATVKKIVEHDLKGTISLESRPGTLTSFTISFPAN